MTLLSPYRVLDLTDDRGHLAGFILARLGAEVIAVEPPGGTPVRRLGPFDAGGSSLVHSPYARGKKSVEMDIATPAGASALRRLVAGADALIESGDPGEMASLGLGPEALAEINPALVIASISPFGQTGPKAGWAATDLTVWASGGPMHMCGDEDRAPLQIGVPQAFLHAAGQAAAAVTLALVERNQSGLGQHIDVSAQAVAMNSTMSSVLCSLVGAPLTLRGGGGIRSGPIRLRVVYPASDGYVSFTHVFGAAIGPATARMMRLVHEAGFCDAATASKDWVQYGMALGDGSETLEEFERIKECVAAFTAAHTKDELFALALEHRLLLAPVATTADVADSEQLASRDYWDVVDGERYPGHWMKPEPTDGSADQVAEVGEHTGEVLASERTPAVFAPAAPVVTEVPAGQRTPAASASLAAAATDRPLAGLKVLDFMWAVAGPTVSRLLADAGATVIRVESSVRLDAVRTFLPFINNEPGPENGATFNNMNAGKLGITLNPGTAAGREVAEDLVRWADVVCESYTPRIMASWGLGYDSVRDINPSVVMLSSCLFGQTGPLADYAGYGNLSGALAGFYNITGWSDRAPVGPYGAITDYTSPHPATASLLAAIDHQRRTGEGRYLDFSQAEASIHFIAPAVLEYLRNGNVVGGRGNASNHYCPHGVFPAAGDDRWVAVVAQDDAAWQSLATLIGCPELADLPLAERLARRDELEPAVATWTNGLDESEAERQCQAAGIAAHRVQNSPELAIDPQLEHRNHWVEVPHATHGTTIIEAPRFSMSRSRVWPETAGPALGEHLYEVLTDHLGYNADQIAELAAAEAFD